MCDKNIRGWTNYCVTGTSLYPIASCLIHLRIPFEFVPHRRKAGKKRNYWQCGYIEFGLADDGENTIADILYHLDKNYGSILDFTILNETRL